MGFRKHFENDDENITYPTLQDIAKAVVRGKLIALNVHNRHEMLKTNDRKLEKEQQK